MAYAPREYWSDRYARQGPLTVGRAGMDAKRVAAQMDAFWGHVGPRVPRPCLRLLDFGCGVGRMAPHAAPLVGELWGADICAEAVRLAAEAHPGHRFVALAGDALPFPDGHFDCVTAVTVLQHIVDEGQFANWCREIARVLRPGGAVVVLDASSGNAPHMRARGDGEVAAALGMAADSPAEAVTAESPRSHWAATFRKAG
jgi:ubiquinone/menaquinone biosynthesis C-methylase UbiE